MNTTSQVDQSSVFARPIGTKMLIPLHRVFDMQPLETDFVAG